MDNMINLYLLDMKKTIETRNKTSDNKAYCLKHEKLEVINGLIASKRIHETEFNQAKKIIGLKM